MVDPPPPRFIFRINRETVLLSERQIYATCTQRQCPPASVRNILLLSSTCTVFTGRQLHHRSSTAARLRAFENGELTPNQESASLRPSVERKGAKEIAKERGWDKRIDPSSEEEGTAPSCGPVVSRALRTKFTTRGWFDGATPRWAACHLFRRLLERGFARRRNNRRGTRLHEALETGIQIPFLDRLNRKSRRDGVLSDSNSRGR